MPSCGRNCYLLLGRLKLISRPPLLDHHCLSSRKFHPRYNINLCFVPDCQSNTYKINIIHIIYRYMYPYYFELIMIAVEVFTLAVRSYTHTHTFFFSTHIQKHKRSFELFLDWRDRIPTGGEGLGEVTSVGV